jgi:hypothetical protein
LTSGVGIGFAPRDGQGLQGVSTADLKAVEVEAFGLGIHFPTLDANLYVPATLEGVLGSGRWTAPIFGWRAYQRATRARQRRRG